MTILGIKDEGVAKANSSYPMIRGEFTTLAKGGIGVIM